MLRGMIINWYGSIESIPAGFVLCDGNNGTPDLRDKFIVGAKQDDGGVAKSNIEGSLKQTGGNTSHQHDTYNFITGDLPAGTDISAGTDFDKEISGIADGITDSKNHINPYSALAYIMKT